jgi:outer membrane protein assembly factor BamA
LTDTSRHKVYIFNNVSIEPNYSVTEEIHKDTITKNKYDFIVSENNFKYDKYLRHTRIAKGDFYQADNVRSTMNQLSEIQMFKFVDIIYDEYDSPMDNVSYLDCLVRLTPMKKRTITFDTEVNTTEENKEFSQIEHRYYGMAGNISFKNRNLFNSFAQGIIKLGGSFDIPIEEGEKGYYIKEHIPREILLTTSVYFPTAFLPRKILWIHLDNLSETSKTAISLAYFYEENFDFKRKTGNFSYTYQFNNPYRKNFFTPVEISLVQTDSITESFASNLNDPLSLSLFDTHMLTISRWTFLYNTKGLRDNRYIRLRVNAESAGNILYLTHQIFSSQSPSADEGYKIFGNTTFYQYLKFDFDASYYYTLNDQSSLAYRINIGLGHPYANSKVLPFEKRYFIGGANSIRAWKHRDLGPGAKNYLEWDTTLLEFVDKSNTFDHTGDIRLETNLELRFDMISTPYLGVKGALFADVGNIWNWEDTNGVANFQFNRFISELAMGAGFGVRFDFIFFILRTDFAIRLHDPSLQNNRWVAKDLFQKEYWSGRKNFRINIGIGYPF